MNAAARVQPPRRGSLSGLVVMLLGACAGLAVATTPLAAQCEGHMTADDVLRRDRLVGDHNNYPSCPEPKTMTPSATRSRAGEPVWYWTATRRVSAKRRTSAPS
jgi:hypothetical protein